MDEPHSLDQWIKLNPIHWMNLVQQLWTPLLTKGGLIKWARKTPTRPLILTYLASRLGEGNLYTSKPVLLDITYTGRVQTNLKTHPI